MTPHGETLAALSRLKNGEAELSREQYLELLEAMEQAVQALILAPTGSDSRATGLWYNHERAPALARLAEALAPEKHGAATAPAEEQLSDRDVLLELHAALLRNSR
ncbi:MAG TPA: hypothetical protein VG293_00855 [Solirubrobacteraceae bacterium]|nr:hypothetical protein [Solirubrobacteraceae bacterium]